MSCHFSVQSKIIIICTGGSYYTGSDKSWQGISPESPYSKETEGGWGIFRLSQTRCIKHTMQTYNLFLIKIWSWQERTSSLYYRGVHPAKLAAARAADAHLICQIRNSQGSRSKGTRVWWLLQRLLDKPSPACTSFPMEGWRVGGCTWRNLCFRGTASNTLRVSAGKAVTSWLSR